MGLSIIISLSRGGMIALAAAVFFLGAVAIQMELVRRRRSAEDYEEDEGSDDEDDLYEEYSGRQDRQLLTGSRSRLAGARVWWAPLGAVALIVLLLLGGMLWLGPDKVASRVTQSTLAGKDIDAQNFYASRGFIWRDTMKMIKDNPIVGVGLGAFPTAFPRYTESDGTYLVLQAHNDMLQIFADGGLIGGVLCIVFVILVARSFARGLKAADSWRRAMALGMGTAMLSLLVHSLFDWNLQVTSTVLLFMSYGAIIGRIGEKVVEHEASMGLELVSSRGVVTR